MRILIKALNAENVNLFQNDMVSGLISPMSVLGFCDALERKSGGPGWSWRILPIFHALTVHSGRIRAENDYSVEKKAFTTTEIAESLTGDLTASFLIDTDALIDLEEIETALSDIRIAGSTAWVWRGSVVEVKDDGSTFFEIPRGYALCPSEGSAPVSNGSIASLNALVSRLYPKEDEELKGWHVPISCGYHYLEDPQTVVRRTGTRRPDMAHVFAEPLASIGELISVRNMRLTDKSSDEMKKIFWKWCFSENGAFSHPIYSPNSIG